MWWVFFIINYFIFHIKFNKILFWCIIFQIVLQTCFNGVIHNHCLMSVGETDFWIPKKGRKFHSFKFKKSALRYEIAPCIMSLKNWWICRPYTGDLEQSWDFPFFYENVDLAVWTFEADDGNVSKAPFQVKCPKTLAIIEKQHAMMNCFQSLQEMVNNWFRDITMHHNIFATIAVITQFSINNGKELFKVDYGTNGPPSV